MSAATTAWPGTAANDTGDVLVIACPTDGALNRVPRAKLGQQPNCGVCHKLLFEGHPVELDAAGFERHAVRTICRW